MQRPILGYPFILQSISCAQPCSLAGSGPTPPAACCTRAGVSPAPALRAPSDWREVLRPGDPGGGRGRRPTGPENPRVVRFGGQQPDEYAPGAVSWLSPFRAFIIPHSHAMWYSSCPVFQFRTDLNPAVCITSNSSVITLTKS